MSYRHYPVGDILPLYDRDGSDEAIKDTLTHYDHVIVWGQDDRLKAQLDGAAFTLAHERGQLQVYRSPQPVAEAGPGLVEVNSRDCLVSGQIVVAEEPVEPALAEVRELLVRTRTYDISLDRLRWMYLANPDGPAILWTVRQEGKLQGFTACLPRRMIFNGEQFRAWIGADFSMDPAQRTLGPAAMLRRQARLESRRGRADFLYAHPMTAWPPFIGAWGISPWEPWCVSPGLWQSPESSANESEARPEAELRR